MYSARLAILDLEEGLLGSRTRAVPGLRTTLNLMPQSVPKDRSTSLENHTRHSDIHVTKTPEETDTLKPPDGTWFQRTLLDASPSNSVPGWGFNRRRLSQADRLVTADMDIMQEHMRRQTVAYEAVRHGGAMPESPRLSTKEGANAWRWHTTQNEHAACN